MRLTRAYRDGISAIDGLQLLTEPDLSIINFGAETMAVSDIAAGMQRRGWLPGMTQQPAGLHAMLSLLHEPAREAYLADLAAAVAEAAKPGAGAAVDSSYA